MMLLTRETLEEIIDRAELYELNDESIYEEYAGRGMYGRTCFAVVVDGTNQAMRFVAASAVVLHDDPGVTTGDVDPFYLARQARLDNLGSELIVYFPDVVLVD